MSIPIDFRGVLPVPPLARKNDARRSIDFAQNDRLVRHMAAGGITRLIYGGNALLYHITLADYEPLLDWLAGLMSEFLVIPSAGPSYGRAMDQAPLLRKHRFPCVMILPCGDPRDARGLEQGMREISDACRRGAFDAAEPLRAEFLPLEDLRDAWGPSKVLHFATALAGLADTGPILPYFSPLPAAQMEQLKEVARPLATGNAAASTP